MEWPILTTTRPGERVDFTEVEAEFRRELTSALMQHDITTSVATIRDCFGRYQRYEEIFDDVTVDWCDRIRMTRVAWKLAKLWNYTPRADLGQRRPAELLVEQSRTPQSQHVSDEALRFVRLPGMFTQQQASAHREPMPRDQP
ncbi:MAG: hypothetical protein AAF581_00700 [Planctomycetota bacterium]